MSLVPVIRELGIKSWQLFFGKIDKSEKAWKHTNGSDYDVHEVEVTVCVCGVLGVRV